MGQLKIIVDAYQPTKSVYVKFIVDEDELSKRLMTINNKLRPLSSKDGKGVQLIVPSNVVSKFIDGSILKSVYEMCGSYGFSLPEISEVRDDIIGCGSSIITNEMKGEATSKANDLIEKFFERYSEPEVMDIINKLVHDIKVNVGDDDKFSHAILSKNNRLLAYAQKPDAKYIASRKTWREVFGRRVNVGATLIIIKTGNNGGNFDTDYADNKIGMDRETAYQNSHVRISYDRLAKYGQTEPTNFYGIPYFDISDTVPYNDTDRFSDDEGLDSNLTGVLNNKALEAMPKDAELEGDIINKLGDDNSNESRVFNNIVNYTKDKAEYKAVMIAANGKDSNSCADVVEALFRVKFEREHNLDLLNKKVKKCTAVVLSLYKIASKRVLTYIAQGNDIFNRKDLTEMYSQLLDVVDIIDNSVKESIGNSHITFKEFLDVLNIDISSLNKNNQNSNSNDTNNNNSSSIDTERDKLGESFRRLWNRML